MDPGGHKQAVSSALTILWFMLFDALRSKLLLFVHVQKNSKFNTVSVGIAGWRI